MVLRRNAKLGLAGRYALVRSVEGGCSLKAAAAAFNVSPATACRWSRRWRAADAADRATLVCLHDRSRRPKRMPRLLSGSEQRRILRCQAAHRLGPAAAHAPDGSRALDDLEGARPARTLAPATRRARTAAPLRVALPR
jgi:hypothetical protein